MSSLYPANPVVLVDDEKNSLEVHKFALESAGISNVVKCSDSREVMSLVMKEDCEVMVLDLLMPHVSGDKLLKSITADFPDIPVIMTTAVYDLDMAVQCMKQNAFDYIIKPVEASRFVSAVKRAVELRELRRENDSLKACLFSKELKNPDVFEAIVTCNQKMISIFQYVEAIAKTPYPILITGETGVGKELLPRAAHELSGRTGELVAVNVAGLDDNVFSDTLFGHKKGAFTGADEERRGLIEKASGGTLLLDEIGDLGKKTQVKLLRLLEGGQYYPLGSDVMKLSDARIIVSTNRDLAKLVEQGDFRQDLYHRLSVHKINIPPLRDRADDLPFLINHFIDEAANTLGKEKPKAPVALVSFLSTYHFPGNVRELQRMVMEAVSMHTSGELSMEHFLKAVSVDDLNYGKWNAVELAHLEKGEERGCFSGLFGGRFPTIKEVEHALIQEAMARTNKNQSLAAQLLGLSRSTLSKRLKA